MTMLALPVFAARRAPRFAQPLQNVRAHPPPARTVLSFARTKIQRPQPRPGALMPRPALTQRLVEALTTHPLVLLQAAAGFGKTSALVQALDQLPKDCAVAWVACDESDAPLQLFACLVAALEPYDLPWRVAPDSLIDLAAAQSNTTPESRARSHRRLAAELINALDAGEAPRGVIVVDDLHRVTHPAVHEFIDVLMERFTPRWCMAIATRHEPPLALARLRARGEMAEFHPLDLRLDGAQMRTLAAGAGLDADAADALHERTQGWAAGAQLALSVLRRTPSATLAGSAPLLDRRVFEFLATEVLDRLDPVLREFLVTTSVLPELTAARCAALTGDPRAAERLEAIERAGLFVTTLPEPEPTLRLHDLFRDALEHLLQRERPDDVPVLLERAARSESDGVRRLGYWLRAEHWDEAARELHMQSYSLLTAGQSGTVERWLARFPPQHLHNQPDLLIVRTLQSWMHWRWSAMIAAAQGAAERFEQAGRPLDALAARAYGVLALRSGGQREASDALARRIDREVDALLASRAADMRAGRRWEEHEPGLLAALLAHESAVWAAFDDARLADLATPTARSISLLDHTTGLSPFFQMLPLPGYIGLPGMRLQLERYVRKARERLGDNDTHLGTLVQAIDGGLRVWSGDVAAGRALLRECAAEVRWHDFPLRATDHVYPFLCVADVLVGDSAALAEDAAQFEQVLLRASELPDIGRRVASEVHFTARWLLAGGLADRALHLWRHVAAWSDPGTRPLWQMQMSALPAFVALAEGRPAEAERGFTAALAEHGRKLDLQGQWTELQLRTAALRLQLGRSVGEAAPLVREVVERHAGDVDLAPVWLVAPELNLLAQARWGGALDVATTSTLSRWAAQANALRAPAATTAATGRTAAPARCAGPLSEREFEVLERLAAGDSNKLIARAFDLSPHTVKRHVANILDKLALRSRGQAAAWFHEHGA
jgi:LuxR family transcriptional regulator, maltose regulon positive regulatory protein